MKYAKILGVLFSAFDFCCSDVCTAESWSGQYRICGLFIFLGDLIVQVNTISSSSLRFLLNYRKTEE